ncbi:MAG: hypothetical protein ACKOE2_13905 [Actinomycetales bacterium]
MMIASRPRRQLLVGITVATLLVMIALAGADHPPPPGFFILIGLVASWSAVVCAVRWRTRTRPRAVQAWATSGVGGLLGLLGWLALIGRASFAEGISATATGSTAIGLVVSVVPGGCGGLLVAVASWMLVDRPPRSTRDQSAP